MLRRAAARSSALACAPAVAGLDAAPHAAPQIGLPARAHADADRRRGDAAVGGRSARAPADRSRRHSGQSRRVLHRRAACAWRYCASAWREVLVRAHRRACIRASSVGSPYAVHQGCAAVDGSRLGGLPRAGLLVGRRARRAWGARSRGRRRRRRAAARCRQRRWDETRAAWQSRTRRDQNTVGR